MIEHVCAAATINEMYCHIGTNETLYNELYPRNDKWTSPDADHIKLCNVKLKFMHNKLTCSNDGICVGSDVSAFNSSVYFNTAVIVKTFERPLVNDEEEPVSLAPIHFAFVVTTQDVEAEQELCSYYSYEGQCINETEHEQVTKRYLQASSEIDISVYDNSYIKQYLKTYKFLHVIESQLMAQIGIYFGEFEEKLWVKFRRHEYQDNIRKYFKITSSTIGVDVRKVYECMTRMIQRAYKLDRS